MVKNHRSKYAKTLVMLSSVIEWSDFHNFGSSSISILCPLKPHLTGWGPAASVGVGAGWVAHSLCFLSLQTQLWQWIDGSIDLYSPWNYKTKSGANYCAALNPKDSKFPAPLPFLQAATPSLNLLGVEGACLPSSHRPCHSAALPHRTAALTHSLWTSSRLDPLWSLC